MGFWDRITDEEILACFEGEEDYSFEDEEVNHELMGQDNW